MNKILISVIMASLIGGGAFYGGMKYAQSKTPQGFIQKGEERQQRFQQMGAAGMVELRSERPGDGVSLGLAGLAAGEIIAKDDQSITVKLPDGGSKIIFYSENTEVGKFVNGTPDDLEIGKSIMIDGKANEDGSITAQSIQLRPEMIPPQ